MAYLKGARIPHHQPWVPVALYVCAPVCKPEDNLKCCSPGAIDLGF